MSEVRIAAEPRNEFGKGGARRTRRAGKVPAVLYGHGTDVRHISLPARELLHAFKGASGTNVILSLDLPDGRELALPRQVQRDPLRGDLTHVDLVLVRKGEQVAVDVPIVLVGEAPAARAGGALDQQATFLHVQAEATNIPSSIEVDISGLTEIGAHGITAAEVRLPEGTVLLGDPEAIVVHVVGASPIEDEVADAAEAAAAAEEDTSAGAGEAAEGADSSGE
ncbi:MAG TPA: 50S ribosomal protein L25/general stress protein Ctc [Frankiaceae bacterium]|nr:50S ribosomal protein L25/general stress protein Ctc [Frankiaceae bacterium]